MKTGISTIVYRDYEPNIRYEKIRTHGYDCVNLDLWCDPNLPVFQMEDGELSAFLLQEKAWIEGAGLEIEQFHGVWPTKDTSEELRAYKTQLLIKNIRMCQILRCPHLVIHPDMPYGWGAEADAAFAYQVNLQQFRQLLPYAEQAGVTLCLENMPFKLHAISTVKRSCDLIDEIGHPNLGLCLDTGHAMVFGDQAGEMVRYAKDRLKTLHIHDNDGTRDAHWDPFCGSIDWEDFRLALQEIGFGGVVSLETNPLTGTEAEKEENCRRLFQAASCFAGQ